MKKIIISLLVLLTLTSCGTPKIDSPADALKQNQTLLIEDLEKLIDNTPKNGESKGEISFEIKAKEGNIDGKVNYISDYLERGLESSSNIKVSVNANIDKKNQPSTNNGTGDLEISGNLDLDLISLKNKVIFKLNSLNIDNIENTPELAMVMGMVAPFQKKWYFLELPKDEYNQIQKNIIKNIPNILKELKDNSLFTLKKENKNNDYYDYDVIISDKSIIAITQSIKNIALKDLKEKQKLTKQEIKDIKKSVEKINNEVSINIKIDKSNLKYFILSTKNKNGDLKITNSKTNIDFIFENIENKDNISFIGKKTNSEINGNLSIKNKGLDVFNGNLYFHTNGKETKVLLDGKVKNKQDEVSIKLELKDKTTKKSIKIDEHKDAKNFQEVIGKFMGGMMGGNQINSNVQEANFPSQEKLEEK